MREQVKLQDKILLVVEGGRGSLLFCMRRAQESKVEEGSFLKLEPKRRHYEEKEQAEISALTAMRRAKPYKVGKVARGVGSD